MPQKFRRGQELTTPDGRRVRFVRYDEQGKAIVEPIKEQKDQPELLERKPTGPYNLGRLKRDLGIVGRSALQGGTFGFSDELRGVGSLLLGRGVEGYKESRDVEREALARGREQAPGLALLGEIGGGVATGFGLAGGGRALAAKGLSRLGQRGASASKGLLRPSAPRAAAIGPQQPVSAAQRAKSALAGAGGRMTGAKGVSQAKATRSAMQADTGGGVLSRLGKGMKLGLGEGALYGYGAGGTDREMSLGESVVSRLRGAGTGAVLGAGAAGLLGGGAMGLSRLKRFSTETAGIGGGKGAQKRADEVIIQSLMEENPEKFLRDGQRWLSDVGIAAQNPIKQNLDRIGVATQKEAQDLLDDVAKHGESDIYAGAMAAARDAARREADPNVVTGLLADKTDDLTRTAAEATTITGRQQGKLKGAVEGRGNLVGDTLEDMKGVAQLPKSPGSARSRLKGLEEERATQAAKDYDDFYHMDAAQQRMILSDKRPGGLIEVMNNIRGAGRQSRRVIDEIEKHSGSPEMVKALEIGAKGGGRRMPRELRQILKPVPKGGRKAGQVDASMEDLDLLRRSIKGAERQLKIEDDLAWKSFAKLADDLDEAIGRHSPQYKSTRKTYEVNSRRLESYEEGAKTYNRAEDLAHAYENAHISKSRAGTKTPDFTDAELAKIKADFRQGRFDDLADQAQELLRKDNTGLRSLKYLEDQFAMMFDPPNGAFRDLMSPDEIVKAKQQIGRRFRQSQTTQAIKSAKPQGRGKEASVVEGAPAAMAGLYLGAGQAGAAGRTLVQSFMYSPTAKKKMASALAKRLQQSEADGLLAASKSVGGTELKKLRGLLYQQGAAGAGGAGVMPVGREMTTTDSRYGGYRPEESLRRRQMEGLLAERR